MGASSHVKKQRLANSPLKGKVGLIVLQKIKRLTVL